MLTNNLGTAVLRPLSMPSARVCVFHSTTLACLSSFGGLLPSIGLTYTTTYLMQPFKAKHLGRLNMAPCPTFPGFAPLAAELPSFAAEMKSLITSWPRAENLVCTLALDSTLATRDGSAGRRGSSASFARGTAVSTRPSCPCALMINEFWVSTTLLPEHGCWLTSTATLPLRTAFTMNSTNYRFLLNPKSLTFLIQLGMTNPSSTPKPTTSWTRRLHQAFQGQRLPPLTLAGALYQAQLPAFAGALLQRQLPLPRLAGALHLPLPRLAGALHQPLPMLAGAQHLPPARLAGEIARQLVDAQLLVVVLTLGLACLRLRRRRGKSYFLLQLPMPYASAGSTWATTSTGKSLDRAGSEMLTTSSSQNGLLVTALHSASRSLSSSLTRRSLASILKAMFMILPTIIRLKPWSVFTAPMDLKNQSTSL